MAEAAVVPVAHAIKAGFPYIQRKGNVITWGVPTYQCSGSMTFWCGSGSADPCLLLMDPDPAIFVTDLQDANKKLISKKF